MFGGVKGGSARDSQLSGSWESRISTEKEKASALLNRPVFRPVSRCVRFCEGSGLSPVSAHKAPCWGSVGRCKRRDNQSMNCTSVYKERAVSQYANFATQKTMNRRFFTAAGEFEFSDNSALNPWLLDQACDMLCR